MQSIAAASTCSPAPRTLKFKAAEKQVCQFLEKRGWRDLRHDVRLFHVQVDILARSPLGVLSVIEVKMRTSSRVARLTARQALRLMRVTEALSLREPVELWLAFVEGKKVRLLPVDALTEF